MQEIYIDGFESMSKEGMVLSKKIRVIQVKSKISNSNLNHVKAGSVLEIQFNLTSGRGRYPTVSILDESGNLLLKGKTVHISAHISKLIYEEI